MGYRSPLYADKVTIWKDLGEDPNTLRTTFSVTTVNHVKVEYRSAMVSQAFGTPVNTDTMVVLLPMRWSLPIGKTYFKEGEHADANPPSDAFKVDGVELITMFGRFHHMEVTAK